MKKTHIFIISVITASVICGLTAKAMAAAVVAVVLISWLPVLINATESCACAVNNPAQHNPEIIATALEQAFLFALKSGKAMTLQISNPGVNPLVINSGSGGEMLLADSRRTLTIGNSVKWIADHPLPIKLKAGHNSVLRFVPATDGKIRVSAHPAKVQNRIPVVMIPMALALLYFEEGVCAAALFAAAIHLLLINHISENQRSISP